MNWIKPAVVSTPNIEYDIRNLLSDDILRLYQECADKDKRNRIVRIAEMLDYANHLSAFTSFLNAINKPTYRKVGNLVYKDDHIEFEGHDYSGCEFDIEAMIYYLQVSIIDTCMAKSENYHSVKDFLNGKVKGENVSKAELLTLCDEYTELYGLSKNFQEVFMSRISEGLKLQFVESILVLGGRNTDYTRDEIIQKWQNWQRTDITVRLKKIATTLYNIRSQYTHSNIRSFIPKRKWNEDTLHHATTYLVKEGCDVLSLLKAVIDELCIQLLQKKQNNEKEGRELHSLL